MAKTKRHTYLQYIIQGLFAVLLIALFFRSTIFVYRIMHEIANTKQAQFYPEITPCSNRKDMTGEKVLLYYYRSLGSACKK